MACPDVGNVTKANPIRTRRPKFPVKHIRNIRPFNGHLLRSMRIWLFADQSPRLDISRLTLKRPISVVSSIWHHANNRAATGAALTFRK